MTELPKPGTIPHTSEHMEAYQAQINQHRAEQIALLPAEEQAKSKVIEQASALLEAAEVPFLLFASLSIDKGPGTPLRLIRFQRLEYIKTDNLKERTDLFLERLYWALGPMISEYAFKVFGGQYVAVYDENQQFMFGHDLRGAIPKVVVPPKETE